METTYRTRHWTLQLQGAMQLKALSRIWCAVCDRCDERGTVYQNVNVAESSSAHVAVCLPCWATITAPAPTPGAPLAAPTVTSKTPYAHPRQDASTFTLSCGHGFVGVSWLAFVGDAYRCLTCEDAPDPQTPAAREATLPAYNPEDGAPCAQCGHGQELHYEGVGECWECSDTTPPVGCPCPQFQAREAAQRADEAELHHACVCGAAVQTPGDYCPACIASDVPAYFAPDHPRFVSTDRADEAELQAGLLASLPPMAGGSVAPRCPDCGDSGAARDCEPCVLAPLPPMAGGAPSHYDDPAWYADEAWALQEEHNAESARTCDYCGEVCCSSPCRPGGRILQGEGCTCDACGCSLEGLVMQRYHTHFCPTCHQTRPCTATGCADGPRECATCSQCRGW